MDGLVDDRVNILGFSIFNQSHTFFREFAQSLDQSWQENCDHAPFRGPAVSATQALLVLGPPSLGSLLGPTFSRPSWEWVPGNSVSMLCMSPAHWGETWGQSAGSLLGHTPVRTVAENCSRLEPKNIAIGNPLAGLSLTFQMGNAGQMGMGSLGVSFKGRYQAFCR